MPPIIRELDPSDDLVQITSLIHAAYAPHARSGLRYWGTHQSPEDTAKRFASGRGYLMLESGDCVGTVTLRPPQPNSAVNLYRDTTVWSISQFCVSPNFKSRGYGRILHDYVMDVALSFGAKTLALDTARPAIALISKYESWGYKVVGACDWRPDTNYESVLMAKMLTT